MRKNYLLLSGSLLVLVMAWLFIGLDRYVGDHEVGTSWMPFFKSVPTTKVLFHNPAQHALDRQPFHSLDSDRQEQFMEYCRIRYGTRIAHDCEVLVERGRI